MNRAFMLIYTAHYMKTKTKVEQRLVKRVLFLCARLLKVLGMRKKAIGMELGGGLNWVGLCSLFSVLCSVLLCYVVLCSVCVRLFCSCSEPSGRI